MSIDLGLYLVHLATIKRMIETRDYEKVDEIVSDMAIATQCHILVCYYYTMHVVGSTPSLLAGIELSTEFYKIKEIKGWPLVLGSV